MFCAIVAKTWRLGYGQQTGLIIEGFQACVAYLELLRPAVEKEIDAR